VKPIVPEVCDRLNCKIPSCYGWDLCRQAREEATDEEWDRLVNALCNKWEKEASKLRHLKEREAKSW
jgi:hypothetical protein